MCRDKKKSFPKERFFLHILNSNSFISCVLQTACRGHLVRLSRALPRQLLPVRRRSALIQRYLEHQPTQEVLAYLRGGEHIGREEMGGIHHAHHGDIHLHIITPQVELHSMKSVDEYFIAGEVITEIPFGQSVVIIFFMVDMQMGVFSRCAKRTAKV